MSLESPMQSVHQETVHGTNSIVIVRRYWDFPGAPVIGTSSSSVGDAGSTPGWGTRISYALCPEDQSIEKQYRNKFNKDFKNGPPKSCYILVISIIARSINTNSGAQRSDSAEEVLVITGKARGSRNISGRSIP